MTQSGKKAVITKSPAESTVGQVNFDKQRFDSTVFDKGQKVYIDKALQCPCRISANNSALSDCQNCLGKGFIFIDRKETNVVIQGLFSNKKYETWSETTQGMARLTARAIDRVSIMDKITLLNSDGIYNEVIRPKQFEGKFLAYTVYEPIEIQDILYFIKSDKKLVRLTTKDYTLEGDKLIFSDELSFNEKVAVTIRYVHKLAYHVIDMNRDVMSVKQTACKENPTLDNRMPISGFLRKAHYIFDQNRYSQIQHFDNSKQ